MTLPDGYSDVPPGMTASVVTWLQMLERPPERAVSNDPSWSLDPILEPDLSEYRDLYRRVGGEWLWYSRLAMSDAELRDVLAEPGVDTYYFRANGTTEGLVELDFRNPGECELSYFGLTGPMVGKGAGRWLMERLLTLVWNEQIDRFWLHTCSLDHPAALDFYIRPGFAPYARQVEITDDPRVTGILPRTAAPQVPII